MISEKILEGRKIIEVYREEHEKLYPVKISMEELAEEHRKLTEEMRENLEVLGFKDEQDLFEQSREADKKENIEAWK